MEYTNADILNLFYIHGESARITLRTCRTFNERYPHLPAMTEQKFRRIEKNFLNFGKVNAPRNLPKPIVSNEAAETNVLGYFNVFPDSSVRSAERDLGYSRSSIDRILNNHKMHDFKFSTGQELHPQDQIQRVQYCEMMLVKIQEDSNFLQKIIWSDESKFSKEGIINRHNLHIWSHENPFAIRPYNYQQKFSFNVFAMLMNHRVYYFIYDENLNGERYLSILRNQVHNFLQTLPQAELETCWYQLDGAPAHCTAAVGHQLEQMFEDRWIRRLGPWLWPARSPDLTPLDFYLWGTIKSKVYRTPVNTKEELRNRVIAAFNNLDPLEISRATIQGVETRLMKCMEVNGAHFENLI